MVQFVQTIALLWVLSKLSSSVKILSIVNKKSAMLIICKQYKPHLKCRVMRWSIVEESWQRGRRLLIINYNMNLRHHYRLSVPPGFESLAANWYKSVYKRNSWCLFGCRCVQGAGDWHCGGNWSAQDCTLIGCEQDKHGGQTALPPHHHLFIRLYRGD